MHFGTVIQFFPAKGFGFIRPDFGQDVFFHVTALGACREQPAIEPGQMVKYELMPSAKPNAPVRSKSKNEKQSQSEEPSAPQAMMVELVDNAPAEPIQGSANKKTPSVRHPNARHKKPTWRR